MESKENHDLSAYNSFGISSRCRSFIEITSEEDVHAALTLADDVPFVLGGGSNLLLPSFLDRLVFCNRIGGQKRLYKKEDHTIVELGAGENWHQSVLWALGQGLGGMENLSLIPGTVGAAPIQNIGAYGVELKDIFHSLDAIELSSGLPIQVGPVTCDFGYRDSIFKREWKGKYIITRVRLRLSHTNHRLRTTYGAIQSALDQNHISKPGIKDISEAVISIRNSKLPDPAILGNSGSFFKNPIIGKEHFSKLQINFSDLKYYPTGPGKFKIPAGWMIDVCGWKGKRIGDVGCYHKQALVIVNHGEATAGDIRNFAAAVIDSVYEKFGIKLEPEVNIL